MALPTLTRSDFTGSLLVNYQTERFEQYISEYYPIFVRQAIGDLAYIDIVLTTQQKWIDLFAGGAYYDAKAEKNAYNEGLTNAVKNFIYSAFTSDNFVPTNNGVKKPLTENSERPSDASVARRVQDRYNKAVFVVCDVAKFVYSFKDFEQAIDTIVDVGGGVYRIETTATKYLADGDTITITGTEYEIAGLVDSVSFTIESDTLPVATSYISNPFADVKIGNTTVMV